MVYILRNTPITGRWVLLYCSYRGNTDIWVSPVLFCETVLLYLNAYIITLGQFME